MFRPLSDLNLVNRFDAKIDPALYTAGTVKTGTFMVKRGDDAVLPTGGERDAMIVWTETGRNGNEAAPDATSLMAGEARVTLLQGKIRGLTDQFVGTPAAGDYLFVNDAGKLVVAANAAEEATAVATCTKASHPVTHRQEVFNLIEIFTL